MAIICSTYLQAKNFVPKLYYQLGIRLNKGGQFLKAVFIINYNVKEEAQALSDKLKMYLLGLPVKQRCWA